MNNYKYCPKCGTLIDFKNANYCPQCKTSLYSPTITTIKNIKKRKRGWENYSKILSLIGSIIGLFSIFAPTGSIHLGGLYSWDMWIYGYNVTYDWEEGTEIFWTLNPELLAFSITSTIFIVIGNIMAIIGFVQLLKKKEYAYFLPGIGSVLLVGFILFYLIAYEIYFLIYMGESFWSFLPPSFGFYGQLIAAILMLLAFFFARKSAQYSEPLEKEVHQDKVYRMLKEIIETKFLPENEKNKIKQDLEVISLRIKGISSLQEKINQINVDNNHQVNFESTLAFFQQAYDLSSETNKNISKADISLVEQIINEKDKTKVLNYISEISSHTTLLLGEIVKILS